MSRKSLLVMGMATLVGAGLAWAADPQARGPRPGREERLKQELGLTDAQIDQLQKLKLEERKAAIRRKADRDLMRIELMELLKADAVDEKAVRAKARQMADLEAQAVQSRAEQGLALRKIVSADQAEKLMRLHRRHQRGQRPGDGRGGPEGLRRGPGGPQGPRGPAMGDAGDGFDEDEPPADLADEPAQR